MHVIDATIFTKTRNEVMCDLLKSRFQQNYEYWGFHEESSSDSSSDNDDDFEDDANVSRANVETGDDS